MIVRYIEKCPHCGQWDPWRQYTKKLRGLSGDEVARKYVKCKRCGHREVVSIRKRAD